jgi:hypothetical protein
MGSLVENEPSMYIDHSLIIHPLSLSPFIGTAHDGKDQKDENVV